jgi:glycosidase
VARTTSPVQIPVATSAEWWRQAVVYQICPHRYGDLPGVTSRIPYLASLGIDAVCLSPFQARVGLRQLTSRLRPYGIEVIVDIGPDYARFELLEANWNAGEFLQAITDSLVDAQQRGASTTWVLSGHDAGPRQARAAILLMLALPGSVYLCQGEELGLHEVAEAADIPAGLIEAQEHDPASALGLYRQSLGWRRRLRAAESLEWMPGTNGQVLHFGRPGGWRSVTNFGPAAVPLPPGTVVVASAPLGDGLLPAETTAWVVPGASPGRHLAARTGPGR